MRHEVAMFLARVTGAIRIPAGLKPKMCDGPHCDDMIYFVPATEKRKATPVSVGIYHGKFGATFKGIAPTEKEDGAGISHHANCPDAEIFHKSKRRSDDGT